ncbi:MAG TPA: hypothetical protein VGF41_11940, partial [Myxococcaceae bacterium]
MHSRLALLCCSAFVLLGACALTRPTAPTGAGTRLKPTCADAETDACIAESVTVSVQNLPDLDSGDIGALLAD